MVRVISVDTKQMATGLALILAIAPAVGFLGALLNEFVGDVAFCVVFAAGALIYLMPWIASRPFHQLKFVLLSSAVACVACISFSLYGVEGIYSTMLYGWSILAGCIMGITGMWIALDYR